MTETIKPCVFYASPNNSLRVEVTSVDRHAVYMRIGHIDKPTFRVVEQSARRLSEFFDAMADQLMFGKPENNFGDENCVTFTYPRTPSPSEDLTGKVCVCSTGRVAVVGGRRDMAWGLVWTGFGLDGKGPWASKRPAVLAETVRQYADRFLERNIGASGVAPRPNAIAP